MWSESDEDDWGPEDVASRKRKKTCRSDTSPGSSKLQQATHNTVKSHCSAMCNSERKKIRLSESPLKVAFHQGNLIFVFKKRVEKMTDLNSGELESVYKCEARTEICNVHFFDKEAVVSLHNPDNTNWRVATINLESGKFCLLRDSCGPVRWLLPVAAQNLKSQVLTDSKLPRDLNKCDLVTLVCCDRETFMTVNGSRPPTCFSVYVKQPTSKISFILENVTISTDDVNPAKFVDLLNLIDMRKELPGVFSEEEILDIELCQNSFFILFGSGSLWMYDSNGKNLIMRQVQSLSVCGSSLTVVTKSLRVYTASVKDLKEKTCLNTSESSLKMMQEFVSESTDLDSWLSREQEKLKHIQLFSRLRDGGGLFQVEYAVEQGCELVIDSRPELVIRVKVLAQDVQIKSNFYVIKFLLKSRKCTRERTVPLKAMSTGDAVLTRILFDNLTTQHFPIYLHANIILLENSLMDHYVGFLFSETIFSQQVSPLLFLKPNVIRGREKSRRGAEDEEVGHCDSREVTETVEVGRSGAVDEVTNKDRGTVTVVASGALQTKQVTDTDDHTEHNNGTCSRIRFLNLLDIHPDSKPKKSEVEIRVHLKKIDDLFKKTFQLVLSGEHSSVTFAFNNKTDVEIQCIGSQEDEESVAWCLSGTDRNLITLITKHFSNMGYTC